MQESTGLISVVVPTYNRGESISICLNALLKQTYTNLEIIVSDDCSTDDTVDIVEKYSDKRVKLIKSTRNRGPAFARNIAIKKATGNIVFFTDDDVQVQQNWVKTGLRYFEDSDVTGIEGKILYVDASYKARYGDRVVENLQGGFYMTANAAYRRDALLQVGLFNHHYLAYEDRELALKLIKNGRKIRFAKDSIVYHQHERYTLKAYFHEARKIKYWLMLGRNYGENKHFVGPIYEPLKLIAILFPPLILIKLFTDRFASVSDLLIWLLIYPRLCYERFLLWRYSIREKLFFI